MRLPSHQHRYTIIMQTSSDFELAQKRLKERQRRKSWTLIWLVVLVGMILANTVFGGLGECWLILEILVALIILSNVLQVYYASHRRPLEDDLIAREMEWLFGGRLAQQHRSAGIHLRTGAHPKTAAESAGSTASCL